PDAARRTSLVTAAGTPDLVIVGAGAAGLAAAREAMALGLSVIVLEAKDRVGGRAHTDTEWPGLAWDRGASWIQNAHHNPFARYAEEAGYACDTEPRQHCLWSGRGWANAALITARDAYFDRAFAAVAAAG